MNFWLKYECINFFISFSWSPPPSVLSSSLFESYFPDILRFDTRETRKIPLPKFL